MKTKTQFNPNKNLPPKKDNKKAKRVLLLLIITIIVSFVLTVANTLALFVHVFNDKKQDSLSITTAKQYNATADGYQDSANGHSALEVRLDGLTGFIFYSPVNNNLFVNDYFISYYYDTSVGPRLLFYYEASDSLSVIYHAINNPYSIQALDFDYFESSAEIDVYFGSLGVSPSVNDYPSKVTYQPYYRVINSVVLYGVNCGIEFFRPNGTYYTTYVWIAVPSDGYLHVPLARGRLSSNQMIFHTIPLAPLSYYDFAKNNYDNETIDELKAQIDTLRDFANEQYNAGLEQGRINGEDIGYNNGYNDGLNDANTYTFSNVIGSLIDGPVNAVISLFDFEILGVNLRGFFLSLITCAVVIAIIKIFM